MAGHRRKKKRKLEEGVIVFGRIIKDPRQFHGRPTLLPSGINVLQVIGLIKRGLTDGQIFDRYPSGALDQDDLLACKAWQARFMPETLSHTFNRVTNQNVIMLDENMSYLLLPRVVRLFGRSSHVYADGLVFRHNDDERHVWAHIAKNNYQALVTADDDFRKISQRYRAELLERFGSVAGCPTPAPVVIEVERQHSRLEVGDLLEKYRSDILRFISENDAAYATLDEKNGVVRHIMDSETGVTRNEWISRLDQWRRQNDRPSGPS